MSCAGIFCDYRIIGCTYSRAMRLIRQESNRYRDSLHTTKAIVANRDEKRKNTMKTVMRAPCSECGGPVRRKAITQDFEHEGVKVRVSGFRAWVCTRCGEIYFEPGAADRMAEAVKCLFALASSEKQHKGTVSARLS